MIKSQPCVLTDQGSFVLPGQALLPPLPGDASFRAASDGQSLLLGVDIARLGSGLAFVAPECLAARPASGGVDVGARTALVLERLGLARFGAEHLVACLTHAAAAELLSLKPTRWLLDLYLGLSHLSELARPAPEPTLWARLRQHAPLFRVLLRPDGTSASGGCVMATGAPAATAPKGGLLALWDSGAFSLAEDLPLFLPPLIINGDAAAAAVGTAALRFLDPSTHDARVEAVLRDRFGVCRVTLLQLVARLMELHSDLLQRPQPEAAAFHESFLDHLGFLFRQVFRLGPSHCYC